MGTLRAGSRGLRSVFGPSSQQLSWSRVPQRSVPAQGLLVQALGAPGPTAEACRAAVTPVCTTDALDGQKRGVKVGHGTTGPTAHTQPWGWGWGWGGSTDLAVGTAGPASKTVSAAGIVVVAEAPFPTRHVAHTGQVGGREGRVLLLLTCSGLHVAGVASRAAVLAVLTAHGLGEERCYTPLPPPPGPASWLPGNLAPCWGAGHPLGTHVGQLAAGPALAQARAAGLPHRATGVLVTARGVSGLGRGSPAGGHLVQSGHHVLLPLTVSLADTRVALGAAVLVVRAADSLGTWQRRVV